MLVLSRRIGEEIVVGNDIRLTLVSVQGGRVKLGISAPTSISIRRAELAPVGTGEIAVEMAAAAPVLVDEASAHRMLY